MMEGTDKAEDLSDRRMRLIVKKDSDSRLKSELIGSQSILTPEEVNDLSRASLVGYVTLLRQLNKCTNSCRNTIDDFDPQKSNFLAMTIMIPLEVNPFRMTNHQGKGP